MADTNGESAAQDPVAGLGASVEDIEAALGLPSEAEEQAAAAAAKDEAAKGTAAKDDKSAKTEEEAKPEKSEEEAALEEWKAVRARSRARRAEREAALRGGADDGGDTMAQTDTKATTATTATAKPATEAGVKTLVADVIAALSALDEDSPTAAPEAPEAQKLAATAKREAALASVKEKLEQLGEVMEDSVRAKEKYGELEKTLTARLEEIEGATYVFNLADQALARHEASLPNLSRTRNAAQILVNEAAEFFKRNGKAAPMAFVAERVERVLARRAAAQGATPEKNGRPSASPEKQHSSRKTTSSTLATPPSRRVAEDKRTPKEVEDDLFASLGIPRD